MPFKALLALCAAIFATLAILGQPGPSDDAIGLAPADRFATATPDAVPPPLAQQGREAPGSPAPLPSSAAAEDPMAAAIDAAVAAATPGAAAPDGAATAPAAPEGAAPGAPAPDDAASLLLAATRPLSETLATSRSGVPGAPNSAPAPAPAPASADPATDPGAARIAAAAAANASAAPAPPTASGIEAMVTADAVNLRAGPSTANPVVGSVGFGDRLERMDDGSGGWSAVRHPQTGQAAYIASRFLVAAPG